MIARRNELLSHLIAVVAAMAALLAALVFSARIAAAQPAAAAPQAAPQLSAADQSLLRDLASNDPATQQKALDSLAAQGRRARFAVADIAATLTSSDEGVRWRACRALATIGVPAASAAPALIKALGDSDPKVRGYAAYALGYVGVGNPDVPPALSHALTDKEKQVRRTAFYALVRLRPGAKVMLPLFDRVLAESDPTMIAQGLNFLTELGPDAVPYLTAALKNPQARYWALLGLAELGPAAKSAEPQIVEALKSKEPEIQLQALLALAEIQEGSEKGKDAILTAATSENPGVRNAAMYAIGKLKLPEARELLASHLKDKDELSRTIAAWAVAQTGAADKADADTTLKSLSHSLNSSAPHVRQFAARGLGDFGVLPAAINQQLIAALRDQDYAVRQAALESLLKQGDVIVPELVKLMQDKEIRQGVVASVGRLGPKAKSAVPALIEALKDSDPSYNREADFALAAIGPAAVDAVPELINDLDDKDYQVRYAACYALGSIGPGAKAAVPKLQASLQDQDPMLKLTSVWALLKIQPEDRALRPIAVPLLIEGLKNAREVVRQTAATTLGDLGADSKSAIPALERLVHEDDHAPTRRAALAAIRRIEGEATGNKPTADGAGPTIPQPTK